MIVILITFKGSGRLLLDCKILKKLNWDFEYLSKLFKLLKL